MKHPRTLLTFLLMLMLCGLYSIPAQDIEGTEGCLECHEDEDIVGYINDSDDEVSVFVDLGIFENSVHGDMDCIMCHMDIEELPHEEDLERVDCSQCHDDMLDTFLGSVHGEASVNRQDALAPTCASCHGKHDILPPSDPDSKTYIMNIPNTCGSCHKEGTEMTQTHEIDQKNVLSNYSMSIHGEGLLQRGLTVTAVCTSCHGSHNILPHQNPESSIHVDNVSLTCEQCHAQIEQVHEKIIEGQLWQEDPERIPICVECHSPHEIRRVYYEEIEISDKTCLTCHSDHNLSMEKESESISLFVDSDELGGSSHGTVSCVKCHFDVNPNNSPVCKEIKAVDCSICHAQQVKDQNASIHGKLAMRGDENAPSCLDCHGTTHNILPKADKASPIHSTNIPAMCSKCHADGQPAAMQSENANAHLVKNYSMGIHGKALLESGLTVTAVCTDCHTHHNQLPKTDVNSSVHTNNIAQTCGVCHEGIYDVFNESVHSRTVNSTDKPLPSCADCHESHNIARTDTEDFRTNILTQCGACHEKLTETYFETYHGKVSKLGDTLAAKCGDCHGSHDIFPISDPRSTLHFNNIIQTCKECHPGSHRKFTGYLTHATHHDRENHPELFYTFWAMTLLLVGTFAFFGLHSLMWLIRSLVLQVKKQGHRHHRNLIQSNGGKYYRRFTTTQRCLHVLVIVSFISLALTGMILKFPDVGFLSTISALLGGPQVTGTIHRIGAILTFIYFGIHLLMIVRMLIRKEMTLMGLLTEEYTMIPTLTDGIEFLQNIRWFLGMGPRPNFGRWTYWEKFDYFAVFWGVFIIGSTGLILWFPEMATWLLPGWMINVATVIHSDEALLATGFIFTIHFFNTHFRPCVFPMDPVIFTGRTSLEEFKEERPREYQQMLESGKLDDHLADPPHPLLAWTSIIFGFIFLTTGLFLVGAILYGMLIAYT